MTKFEYIDPEYIKADSKYTGPVCIDKEVSHDMRGYVSIPRRAAIVLKCVSCGKETVAPACSLHEISYCAYCGNELTFRMV